MLDRADVSELYRAPTPALLDAVIWTPSMLAPDSRSVQRDRVPK